LKSKRKTSRSPSRGFRRLGRKPSVENIRGVRGTKDKENDTHPHHTTKDAEVLDSIRGPPQKEGGTDEQEVCKKRGEENVGGDWEMMLNQGGNVGGDLACLSE